MLHLYFHSCCSYTEIYSWSRQQFVWRCA